MVLPLYRDHDAPQRYSRSFNTGLWYEKFFQRWSGDWTISEGGRKNWIEEVAANPVGNETLLKEAILRQVSLVSALAGEYRCFVTNWRFVTGLGRNHPVENGFAWHHTLGVPYLPGSSVKGIVRSWVESWLELAPSEIERVFGPGDKKAEKYVGSVIFFDALPVRPVKLEADVMTPHYQDYYQQEQPRLAPGDWYDPVPIPFLTVAPKQLFLFAVAPRRGHVVQDREDFLKVLGWLTEALTNIGAGAKTAVGYGRLTRQERAEAEIRRMLAACGVAGAPAADKSSGIPAEKPAPAAVLSPFRKEMETDGYSRDPERFMGALTTKWLKKLQDDQTPPDAKREIAVLLKEWYLAYKAEQWRKPNRKNAAKIAEIKKFLPGDA